MLLQWKDNTAAGHPKQQCCCMPGHSPLPPPPSSPICRLTFLELSRNPLGGVLPAAGPELLAAGSAGIPLAAADQAAAEEPLQQKQHQPAKQLLQHQSSALLQKLLLANCSLWGPLPPSWGQVPKLAALATLSLGGNHLTGTIPASWAAMSSNGGMSLPHRLASLELQLWGNQLSGAVPEGMVAQVSDPLDCTPWLAVGRCASSL